MAELHDRLPVEHLVQPTEYRYPCSCGWRSPRRPTPEAAFEDYVRHVEGVECRWCDDEGCVVCLAQRTESVETGGLL